MLGELRKFGITLATALALWAGLLFWRKEEYYFYFTLFSIIFFLSGLFLPVILKPVYRLWMNLTKLLIWFISNVILIILFYLLLTPIAFIARLFGRKFLDLKFGEAKHSYWIPRPAAREKKSYENQF